MARRGRIGTDPGLLDALIEAHTSVLGVLIAQRAAVTVQRRPSVPHGQLQPCLLRLLSLSVLPMSPDVLLRLLAVQGHTVSRQTIAGTLVSMRRAGLVESVGHGKWRRLGSEA